MNIVPNAVPQAPRDDVLSFITDGQPLPPFPFLVGRRGYYADSMGKPGVNDVNLYDDAFFLFEEDRMCSFNGNCDPGKHVPGMANLKPGRWRYRVGIHNLSKDASEHPHYMALVQAAPVTVTRDGGGDDTGFFGINIHCGGNTVTSSAGCQTIPPSQWGDKFTHKPGDFMYVVEKALARYGRSDLAYILTERAAS